jgi:hypothetical protein
MPRDRREAGAAYEDLIGAYFLGDKEAINQILATIREILAS